VARQSFIRFVRLLLGAALVTADPPAPAAELAARVTTLEKLVELANGKAFYLVLDPEASQLTLMLRGAPLARYRVLGLQVGVPRVAFAQRAAPGPWQGIIWPDGRLDPPRELERLALTPPSGGPDAPTAPVVPPTPEEAYPVPTRYYIRFGGGPAIEIRPREADAEVSRMTRLAAWWRARWRDGVAALAPRPEERVRLRVVLAPEDADALYRSLPPDTSLLVVAGGTGGGSGSR
jgi:hypothetical protein